MSEPKNERPPRLFPWNAPKKRAFHRKGKVKPKQMSVVSKRKRAKLYRLVKRKYGLTRRDMGAIGAGDRKAPWKGSLSAMG